MSTFPMSRFNQNSQYSHLDSDADSSYDIHRAQIPYDPPPPTKGGPSIQPFEVQYDSRDSKRLAGLQAKPLPSASARWVEFIPEITNMIFTVLFVGLGIAVIRLKGEPQSGWSDKVVAATRIAPSLFPILFSAVLGNALKVWAHFKVERGTSLGNLEQLMGSQTVASAIKSVYILRAFGVYTLLLIPLWAFNPLGSQASFRSVYLKPQFGTQDTQHSYQNNSMGYEIAQSVLNSGSGWESSMPMVRSLYGSALFAPNAGAQYSNGSSDGFHALIERLGGEDTALLQMTVDGWSNVRIPEIRTLPGYNEAEADKWIDVPSGEMVINYTSIIGVPNTVSGYLDPLLNANVSYSLASSYHDFKCDTWQNISNTDFFDTWMKDNYNKLNFVNKTLDKAPYDAAYTALSPWGSGFFVTTIGNSTPQEWPTLQFVSRGYHSFWATQCEVSIRTVEVNVTCIGHSSMNSPCAVSQIRSVPNAQSAQGSKITGWTAIPHGFNMARDFATILSKTQHSATSTQTELFIADPANAFLGNAALIGNVDVGTLPIELFERRFGLLFNTFWKATVNPALIVGGQVSGAFNQPFVNNTVTYRFETFPVYALDVPWLIVFFLANVVMCAAAIAAVVLKFYCHTPDLLGYVSSLTRDSEFFRGQGGGAVGSGLDGAERARLLKEDRVRIADVKPGDVGRIALVPDTFGGRPAIPSRIYE